MSYKDQVGVVAELWLQFERALKEASPNGEDAAERINNLRSELSGAEFKSMHALRQARNRLMHEGTLLDDVDSWKESCREAIIRLGPQSDGESEYEDESIPTKPPTLVWVEIATTGDRPDPERILELCLFVTDVEGVNVTPPLSLTLYQSEDSLFGVEATFGYIHHRSGLIDRVRSSRLTESDVDHCAAAFLDDYVDPYNATLCSFRVSYVRSFLARFMPRLHHAAGYRDLDVSSLVRLIRQARPQYLGSLPSYPICNSEGDFVALDPEITRQMYQKLVALLS